jgi:glycosyltransferase involved in cell wall biosynthesis
VTARPRVLFVAANVEGTRTGNERTLCRLRRRLEEAGVDVSVVRPDVTVEWVVAELRATGRQPALVHAFHARRSGPRGVELADALGVPLVVGLTGTDLVRDIHDPERAEVVVDVLGRAAAITCGNPDECRTLGSLLDAPPPSTVLPKGTAVPDALPEPALASEPGELLVLQVAHVRPVKNVALAVRALRRLAGELPVRLVVLGDVLDRDYERRCAADAGGDEAWGRILHPAVHPDAVGGYLAAADVVLNTSHGEGGSNAVLESLAHGRAVVASAVPGNLAYVGDDGVRGLTYPVRIAPDGSVEHDEGALVATLRDLLVSPEARERLGDAGRDWVRRVQSPEAERAAVLRAYGAAAPGSFRVA